MLRHVAVRDFSLLRDVALDLGPGLTVISGESGAGKSLLFDAVAFALGGRPQRGLLAAGASSCEVAVTLELDPMRARLLSEPWKPGANEVQRSLNAAGRGKLLVNGAPAQVGAVAEAARQFVEITGQFESTVLFNPAKHLGLLDAYGDSKHQAALGAYSAAYEAYRALAQRLKAARESAASRAQELDFLRFQVGELSKAGVQSGERTEVESRLRILQNAGRLLAAANTAASLLSGEDEAPGAYDLAAQAQTNLTELTGLLFGVEGRLGEARDYGGRLQSVLDELSELASALRDFAAEVQSDPAQEQRLSDRLDDLIRLERKYGCDADALPDLLAAKQDRLALLGDETQSPEELARMVASAEKALTAQAAELTKARRDSAAKLERSAQAYFKKLDFPRVELRIDVEAASQPGPSGADDVEFCISLNPGEPARPLAQVASGGEASRLLLGLKAALAKRLGFFTLMLDEIEAGIGGSAAERVAQVLRELAGERQVLAITHLAVVAAQAEVHLVARKEIAGQHTAVAIERVTGKPRRLELARMLGGAGSEELALVDKLLKAKA